MQKLPILRLARRITCALLIGLLTLPIYPLYAAPPLPSSFYGTVNLPPGAVISAWIAGVQYAQTTSFNYNGSTVYTLDAPGDDPETPSVVEGGKAGDTITFKVNGQATGQTASWQSGSNVALNLVLDQPTPSLVSVAPTAGSLGNTIDVTLVGRNTHFAAGSTTVNFGAGITINTTTVVSTTQLLVNLTLADAATPGTRDVTVTTGAEIVTKSAAFLVRSGPSVNVHALPNAVGAAGGQVSLPINLADDVTSLNILAYQFDLNFNPGVLQAIGVDKTNTLSAHWTVTETHHLPGQMTIVGYNANPLVGSGVLLNLRFGVTTTVGAQTDLNFDHFRLNEGNPSVTLYNGHFATQAVSISGVITYGLNGQPVPGVALQVQGALPYSTTTDNQGKYQIGLGALGAYTVSVAGKVGDPGNAISALDAARILQCLLNVRPSTDCPLAAADTTNDGQVSALDAAYIARYLLQLTSPASVVGRWNFTPPGRSYPAVNADLPNQNYQAYISGDLTGNWQKSAMQVETATQPDVPAAVHVGLAPLVKQGESAVATLQLTNLTQAAVFGYQLTLTYDPSAWQFVDVAQTDSVSAAWSVVYNAEQPGVLRVVAYGAAALSDNGALLHINLKQLGEPDPAKPVALTAVQFNEGQPAVQIANVSNMLYLPMVTRH
ncbi:MAG: cohesin domain-containing protein [Caldilineaceae bacterium]